jgi:N-acetylglucosaminyl-diphospho-decaprenol L-rhamnosyltransferase
VKSSSRGKAGARGRCSKESDKSSACHGFARPPRSDRTVTDVAVVIVSYNSRDDLARSLPTVAARDRELVVVDNASTDGTPSFVRRRFPDVELVELLENRGYGAACNVGVARTSAPFVLLVNPDAWPIGGGIDELAACLEGRPRVGAAGPVLRTPDGTLQQSVVGFPTRWWLGRPAITSTPARPRLWPSPLSTRTRRFLIGAALLVRRAAFDRVGGFDPDFFMYYEEVDLCWRLQEAGWGVAVCPRAAFVHVGGTATRRDWPAMYREQLRGHLRFLAKHHGLEEAEKARRLLAAATSVRGAGLVPGIGREQRRAAKEAAAWLRTGDAQALTAATAAS